MQTVGTLGSPARNLVICCDGTGKQYGSNNTNVVKLFGVTDFSASSNQLGMYDPGVGTGDPRGALTALGRYISQLAGLALGAGIYRNIADGYQFLMDHYQPGDRVFLFGFSRGAYTVRALAGLLHACGLLHRGNGNLVPYALELFRTRLGQNSKSLLERFAGFKETFSRPCPVHFMGVWDTVKTVGIWDALKMAVKFQTALPYTFDLQSVRYARHAIAIDERRSRFRTNLWRRYPGNDKQQVWFAGVHSDVGGGYQRAGLSNIALNWMLRGAQHHGLRLRSGALDAFPGDPLAKRNTSLTPPWWPLGWKTRTLRGPGDYDAETRSFRSVPAAIHHSVAARMGRCYRPRFDPKAGPYTVIKDDEWDSYREP